MKIQEILHFLTDLKENNNREWFAANKSRYETTRQYFEEIGRELIVEISKFDADIKHLDVKDCIFRIYRDTRFSHDKTPYKSHYGIFIAAAGGRKSERGGYYLHLDPAGCFVAVGVWCPPPPLLKILRESVYHNIDELNEIRHEAKFSSFFQQFYQEDKLKTVPRGFPKDFPDAELLKLKHYMVEHPLSEEILQSDYFVEKVAQIAKAAYPLNRFLNYSFEE